MREYWRCAFVGEGSSDTRLVPVLERLLVSLRPGDDFTFEEHEWRRESLPGRSVAAKIQALANEPYDLVFAHRDADSAGIEARTAECRKCQDKRVVPVVPVRMTEAWALADLYTEKDFQTWWSGKGLGFDSIEACADPKRLLREYLSRSQRTGLLSQTDFSAKRAEVLKGMSVDGPVRRLEAWKMLCSEVKEAMCRVRPYLAGSQWGIV